VQTLLPGGLVCCSEKRSPFPSRSRRRAWWFWLPSARSRQLPGPSAVSPSCFPRSRLRRPWWPRSPRSKFAGDSDTQRGWVALLLTLPFFYPITRAPSYESSSYPPNRYLDKSPRPIIAAIFENMYAWKTSSGAT